MDTIKRDDLRFIEYLNKRTISMRKNTQTLLFLLALIYPMVSMAQSVQQSTGLTGQTKNYISTGMPILLIAPDAVSAGLGDAGVAYEPNAYSAHWNNAKYAFIDQKFGFSTTYTPWLKNLGIGDMKLLYLGGFSRINDRSAFGGSITYFSLGEINSTDGEGNSLGTFKPNEFAIDATYSLKISDNLSLGATGRFIRSDLTNGMDVNDGSGYTTTKPANSVAADIGLYYENKIDKSQEFALGAFISNLGAKLSYSDDDNDKEFLPANLRIGGRYSNEIDNFNKVNLVLDFNKLLVPTPPITDGGVTYSDYYANRLEYNNTGVMQGAIQSFYDAPGGMREELQEIQISAGAEYWYNDFLAVRAGYFYENANKGGRQYFTIGTGIRYNKLGLDVAYLIPTTKIGNNPLTNTLRISLSIDFANEK